MRAHDALMSHTRRASSPHRGVARADASPPSSADSYAERRAALAIAAEVGCDVRTAMRAMREGVDVIRQMRLREELRIHVERWRHGGGPIAGRAGRAAS